MPGEVTGASLATFVLVNSECSLTTPRLPGASDVLVFAAITGTLTDGFFAADFHGIQFLYHAAATAVTTSAVVSSARRQDFGEGSGAPRCSPQRWWAPQWPQRGTRTGLRASPRPKTQR